jgi:uncharacterized membrane protein
VVSGTAQVEQPRAPEATARAVSEATRSETRREALLLLAPALLAFAFCLIQIAGRSLGFDESATYAIVSQHGAALRHAIAHDGGNMSGYYVLLHALVSAFGGSLWVLRLPSAVGIALAVLFAGGLARRLFHARAALYAGLLMAVSMPLVFWGQSARSYALLVAFVAASFWAFVALVQDRGTPRSRRASLLAWACYALATALAMYMSLMAALAVLAQLTTFPWWWRRGRGWIATAILATAALCVPLALLAAGRGSSQLAWVSSPTLTDFKQVFQAITGAGLEPTMRPTATTSVLLAVTLVLLLGVAFEVARGIGKRHSAQREFGPTLLLAWVIVPVVIAWGESLVDQPLFLPRNLLYCAPAVALLLAWAFTRPQVSALLGATCLVVVVGLRVAQLVPSYGVSPEDWQGATAYVLQHAAAGDCALFFPSDGRMAFQYYLSRQARSGVIVPRPVLPRAPWNVVRPFVEVYTVPSTSALAQLSSSCRRTWFISTHQGRRHGSPAARTNYHRYVNLQTELERAYANHSERIFGYASAIHVMLLGP